MIIDKDGIIMNGISMGQYLVQAQFDYNKLWSSDAGRNLAGKQSGTLIGIYPKIIMQFRKLTKEELEIVSPILNSANQSTTYYDPDLKRMNTMETYTGDWGIVNKYIIKENRKNEGFSCSAISVDKRS